MPTTAQTLQSALRHQQEGRLDDAAALCRQVLAAEPQNVNALHLLGVVLLMQGDAPGAGEHLQGALRLAGDHADLRHHLGAAHQLAGEHELAIASYRRALELAPPSASLHHDLAVALAAAGKTSEAEASFQRSIELDPGSVVARNNLGNLLFDQGRYHEAQLAFAAAAQLQPQLAELHFNQGNCDRLLERWEPAAAAYRAALAIHPNLPQAHYLLGVVLERQGQQAEAVDCFREALRLAGDWADFLTTLGLSLQGCKQFDEAQDCFRRALAKRPDDEHLLYNLAVVHHTQGQYPQARGYYHRVLERNPGSFESLRSLGVIAQLHGDWREARACFDRALAIEPQSPDLHFHLGTLLLTLGQFTEGWREYDYEVWKRMGRPLTRPPWDGGPLAGRTVLVDAMFGLGDTIQLVRYLPILFQGGQVLFQCQPALVPLFHESGIVAAVPYGAPLAPFDLQASMFSFPALHKTDFDNLPADVPYLFANPGRVERWRERMAPVDGFRVGIKWQGDPHFFYDKHRSMPLALFEPLARVRDVLLISLQLGFGSEQMQPLADRVPVIAFDEIDDPREGAFLDTAAILMNLDLVITSDSSVAHLAGALGVPVWLPLGVAADFRWLTGREDSPWYPTMRLFRQHSFDDWQPVFARMAAELASLIAGRRN